MMMLSPVARAIRASASGSRARPRLVGSTKVWPPACLNSRASSRATRSSSSWRLSRLELKLWRTQPRFARLTGWRASPRSAPLAGSRNITSKSMRRCSWGRVMPIASPAMGPSTVWAWPESGEEGIESMGLLARAGGSFQHGLTPLPLEREDGRHRDHVRHRGRLGHRVLHVGRGALLHEQVVDRPLGALAPPEHREPLGHGGNRVEP